MRFYEVVARGKAVNRLIISTYWYRDIAEGLPSEQDLIDVANIWESDFKPKLLGAHSNWYELTEIAVYGYRDTWDRAPYLPHIKPSPGVGARPVTNLNPYTAAILSCRVEPMATGPQPDPQNPSVLIERPVRRGYISFGPMDETWIDDTGAISPTLFATHANVLALCDQIKANLWNSTTMVTPLEPIRVSNPPKGVSRRGYGLIRDVVVRGYGTTRRSRMLNRGA